VHDDAWAEMAADLKSKVMRQIRKQHSKTNIEAVLETLPPFCFCSQCFEGAPNHFTLHEKRSTLIIALNRLARSAVEPS
jgi:hypothetical protein